MEVVPSMEGRQRHCTSCGAELDPDAEFCDECGAEVGEDTHVPSETAPTQPEVRPSAEPIASTKMMLALFDHSRHHYVIDHKWWESGSGPIYDEKGKIVGHLYRKIISKFRALEFREADGKIVSAVIRWKIGASRPSLDIKDEQENTIAHIRQKMSEDFEREVWLEDHDGNRILETKGDFLGFTFKVYDMEGQIVAECDKASMWLDLFVSSDAFDFSQKHAIVIYRDIDRRLVVGLAIAIDVALHEELSGSAATGATSEG
jgi:uncharacterized protein YxjI